MLQWEFNNGFYNDNVICLGGWGDGKWNPCPREAKETIFFVNYVRQVVYGFLYELQFTVHQILVSEELIYVKCLKRFILKIK